MNKRGISGVIVALILVLLALVAAGILWFVVTNILAEGSGGISLRKLFVDLEIKKVILGGDNITITIKKTGKEDICGIAFIISDGENSETIKKPTDIQELGEKTFILVPEEISIDSIEKISVAPIFKLESGEEELGNIVDVWIRINGETNGGGGNGGNGNGGTNGGNGNGEECIPNLTACLGRECGNVENGTCGIISCGDCKIIYGSGYICNSTTWQCEIEISLNYGTISSIWPSGATKYFDSNDLPKDDSIMQSYIGKYINFTGSETGCIRIFFAEYVLEYDKSHVKLESVAAINPGDNYEIWTSSTCGSYLG